MRQVPLRNLQEGAIFQRKEFSDTYYERNHYNRKDQFGPACYSCTNLNSMNEIFLKPSTTVWIDWNAKRIY